VSIKTVPVGVLLERLGNGWKPPHRGLAQEFVETWRGRVGEVEPATVTLDENVLYFVTDLSSIHLRGMEQVHCLALAGNGNDLSQISQEYWTRLAAPGRVLFVLALSETAFAQASSALAEMGCLILPPATVSELLDSEDPKSFIKREMRRQLPPRGLIPYSILLSAEGAMFYGRGEELLRLEQEDQVSFAIAGPSRIGKTSLAKQYRTRLVRSRHPRAGATFYIDFSERADRSADGLARRIAMAIESSNRSNRMTTDDLVNFLRFQRHNRFDRPIELILDEVDEVCTSSTFERLAAAAKNGLCRLILCGRGVLLKSVLRKSSLAQRLELMHMKPLDDTSARKLISEPLGDYGLGIREPEQFFERVCRMTGRLPHLVQYYGRRLAELATEQRSDQVGPPDIETLHCDYEAAQYFTSPLADLEESESRLIAFHLLSSPAGVMSIQQIEATLRSEGVPEITLERVSDICNDLFIYNVVTWNGDGSFRVANEGLAFYARQLGIIDFPLADARRQLSRGALARADSNGR